MNEKSRAEKGGIVMRVIVYTSSCIITGSLHLTAPIRLTDLLNNWQERFFPVHDPRVIQLQADQVESVPESDPLLIAREEILLLHELPARAAATKPEGRVEMRVPKGPTPIRAYLGPYRIDGTLYLPQQADIATYLNRITETFLALTDVSICSAAREQLGTVHVPFALARRDRLIVTERQVGQAGEPEN